MSRDQAKRAVGEAAAKLVENGMRIGLGTGSTTAEALRVLGRRVRDGGLDIAGVPTSSSAEQLAREHGIPLITLDDVADLDLALDGADEVLQNADGSFHLIKGRGAAHTRERIVAAQARRFIVLADASKRVKVLGEKMPVPVEVVPMAARSIAKGLRELGGRPKLRMAEKKDGPVVTDQGFWVIDAGFEGIDDPSGLAEAIRALPGVLDHGLFLGMATDVLIGEDDGSITYLDSKHPPGSSGE